MLKHMLTGALFAGVLAGLFAALLQYFLVQPLIVLSERYESGELVHFAGVAGAEAAHDHDHDHDAADAAAATDATAEPAAEGSEAHSHHHDEASGETPPLTRNMLTIGFLALVYVGYGLLLVAGFAVAAQFGIQVTARQGLLWGLAGFAAFQLAPAIGLAPELPGTPAADLTARQIWWVGTAIATAGGLALIGYGRSLIAVVAGAILLALPHVIGAPEPAAFGGVVPPELAASFAARALAVGLASWALLGWLAGRFWSQDEAST
ncbi:CbtA family protein [Tabrizicola sp. J26]|uniref:CbtA family protein n=1 Tax=Alitabrizicola rongguiensis TaxID=2909234 RepID=UPI001F4734DC|nr:CbtA family protein [Tabrizicola rongguiensis]MCF1710211.1 CbtA family protein [Tabrizicola rongguiensis]